MPASLKQRVEKYCPSCKRTLVRNAFPRNRATPDGLHAYCLECNRAKQAADRKQPWHKAMRETYRKVTPNGVAAYKKYYDNSAHKKAAQTELQVAVRRGTVVKPSRCSICNEERRLEGHHEDYAFPLAVIWLCRWCHQMWHRKHGPARSEQSERL